MISPIGNRVVTDDFNLARAESFIFVGKITFGEWVFGKRLDEAENFLLLCPVLRHDCEQSKCR